MVNLFFSKQLFLLLNLLFLLIVLLDTFAFFFFLLFHVDFFVVNPLQLSDLGSIIEYKLLRT